MIYGEWTNQTKFTNITMVLGRKFQMRPSARYIQACPVSLLYSRIILYIKEWELHLIILMEMHGKKYVSTVGLLD